MCAKHFKIAYIKKYFVNVLDISNTWQSVFWKNTFGQNQDFHSARSLLTVYVTKNNRHKNIDLREHIRNARA